MGCRVLVQYVSYAFGVGVLESPEAWRPRQHWGVNDMKLLIVGCEYAGTTTLAHAIDDWMAEAMGSRMRLIHDHWKIPYTVGHPANISEEEERQFLSSARG